MKYFSFFFNGISPPIYTTSICYWVGTNLPGEGDANPGDTVPCPLMYSTKFFQPDPKFLYQNVYFLIRSLFIDLNCKPDIKCIVCNKERVSLYIRDSGGVKYKK